MTQRQVLALLLDADNCIYNRYYRLLLFYLVKNHHDFFKKYSQTANLTAQDILDRKQKIREIKLEMSKLNIFQSDQAFKKLDEEVSIYFCSEEAEKKFNSKKEINFNDLLLHHFHPYINAMENDGDDLMTQVLYLANQEIFLKAMIRLIREEIKTVILYIFSARQSFALDNFNRLDSATGLFMYDIDLIAKKFNELFQEENMNRHAEVCYLTTADSHNNLRPGTARQQVIFGLTDPNVNLIYYDTTYDLTKFSILYNILHHLPTVHPNATIWVLDDFVALYEALYPIFKKYNNIFLKSQCLEFMPYDGQFRQMTILDNKPLLPIIGTGDLVDIDYPQTLQAIAQHCDKFKDKNGGIDAAKHLSEDFFLELPDLVKLSHLINEVESNVKMSHSPSGLFAPDKSPDKKPIFIELQLADDEEENDNNKVELKEMKLDAFSK